MNIWFKGGLAGGLFGALVWLYDYDFLLNMGGPSTPISDSIRELFNPARINSPGELVMMPSSPFLPLVVLILFFLILGLLAGSIIGRLRK